MSAAYDLRPARADDYEALVALAVACADTGKIHVAPKYLRNPVEAWAALKPELEWTVAETGDGLAGAAQVIFSDAEIEGELHHCACLASLMVHPSHRRRGVAKALTRARLDRAGDDTVVVATIQTGNEGSLANARHWATQIFGTFVLPVLRASPGRATPGGFELREPRDEREWDAAAAGLAAFEQGWNLRTPETGASLRERSARTFDGERFLHYFVVVDKDRVVGGFELFEGARLQTLVFEQIPAHLRVLNVFLRLVPKDEELRQNSFSRIWFEQEELARALWAFASSVSAESANAIGTQFDPRGPIAKLVPVRPWTPKGVVSLAVRSPVRLSEEKLLSPP